VLPDIWASTWPLFIWEKHTFNSLFLGLVSLIITLKIAQTPVLDPPPFPPKCCLDLRESGPTKCVELCSICQLSPPLLLSYINNNILYIPLLFPSERMGIADYFVIVPSWCCNDFSNYFIFVFCRSSCTYCDTYCSSFIRKGLKLQNGVYCTL